MEIDRVDCEVEILGRVRILGRKELEHKELDGKTFNSESKVKMYTLSLDKETKGFRLASSETTVVDNGYIHSVLGDLELGVHTIDQSRVLIHKIQGTMEVLYIYYTKGNGDILYIPIHYGEYRKVCIVGNILLVYLPENKCKCLGLKRVREYGTFDKMEVVNNTLNLLNIDSRTLKNIPLSAPMSEEREVVFTDIEEVLRAQ